MLAAVKVVRPTLSIEEERAAATSCAALNAYVLNLSGGAAVLASPVLGAGVDISPLERALIVSQLAGKVTVDDCAAEISRACPGELNGRSAYQVAAALCAEHLPIFRAMGLIPSSET